jgi:RNA polymerase sigma factor (TIGR02999 family)
MPLDIDELIQNADRGGSAATDELFSVLYQELHRLAEHHVRRGGSSLTLGATTLLHEAYLGIAGRETVSFEDQPRFLAYASRAMRGLVIDYARRRRARKRGRQLQITLEGDELPAEDALRTARELEELGDALDELATVDPALAELVDLHFFCGFSFKVLAEVREVSERTVSREWRKARIVLHHALLSGDAPAPNESA